MQVEDVDVSSLTTAQLMFDYFSDPGTYAVASANTMYVEANDGTLSQIGFTTATKRVVHSLITNLLSVFEGSCPPPKHSSVPLVTNPRTFFFTILVGSFLP